MRQRGAGSDVRLSLLLAVCDLGRNPTGSLVIFARREQVAADIGQLPASDAECDRHDLPQEPDGEQRDEQAPRAGGDR